MASLLKVDQEVKLKVAAPVWASVPLASIPEQSDRLPTPRGVFVSLGTPALSFRWAQPNPPLPRWLRGRGSYRVALSTSFGDGEPRGDFREHVVDSVLYASDSWMFPSPQHPRLRMLPLPLPLASVLPHVIG